MTDGYYITDHREFHLSCLVTIIALALATSLECIQVQFLCFVEFSKMYRHVYT